MGKIVQNLIGVWGGGDSNGDREYIGSGNMAWVITAMKNVVTICKWTLGYILCMLKEKR